MSDENPNDEHNQAHAGAMEAVLLDAIEDLTYLLMRAPDKVKCAAIYACMLQDFLTVVDAIGDARDGNDSEDP